MVPWGTMGNGMRSIKGSFQLWAVVILVGIFSGGLYTGHQHAGRWPIPDALILVSLVLYGFLLVRRAERSADVTDVAILGAMTAMLLVDLGLAVIGYGERPMASLTVLPLLLLALYLGVVDVRRRRKTLIP
jgi:hypothetical protein